MCEWIACDAPATWTAFQPTWPPRSARFRFMCDYHFSTYDDIMTGRVKIAGIDKPAGAGDEWRPSLTDMVRLADMEINRQDRARAAIAPEAAEYDLPRIKRMTPAQRVNLATLRSGLGTARAQR